MTFEEWLKDYFPSGPMLRYDKDRRKQIEAFMKEAWEAAKLNITIKDI